MHTLICLGAKDSCEEFTRVLSHVAASASPALALRYAIVHEAFSY